jgi:aminopeptidase N
MELSNAAALRYKLRIMNLRHLLICCVAAGGACAALAAESSGAESLLCRHCAGSAASVESPGNMQYAPDRKVDIRQLALDVTPDLQKRTVRGEATFTFKPIAKPLDELRLDSVDLAVSAVTCSAKLAGHQVTDKEIVVTFAPPVPVGRETKLTIRYSAQPVKGFYFRTPATGYPEGDTHVWSQGEPDEARHWFPCYDYPNAKFTTEITCRVPEGITVLSNGRQISSTKDASGLVAVRWLQDKPHGTHLITLAAGRFTKLEEKYRDVPLQFYTPPSDAAEAALTFADTKPAMEFFEREIGVPYPWAQYGQVVVRDFHWGGMENTTLTTLTDRTLHRADTETLSSSEVLVSHELAHQWFGNLVTCKDWSHLWLNEGFATYYANLYMGDRHGRDELLYGLYRDAQNVLGRTNSPPRAIHFRRYGTPYEQFDYRAYPKGGWVLHMLRCHLGDELFRRCIKTYVERHTFGIVVTEDLNAVIEELSGRSYDRFFDQWVYHALQPELEVNYSWDEKTKLVKISVRQTQTVNDNVMLFQFPLTLRFKSKAGTVDHRVHVKEKEEDFYVPLRQAPEIVRVDPEYSLLAKINFKPPTAMLYAQLADKSDMIGRLLAAEQLADKKDSATVAKLKAALNADAFHGVRAKASESLRKIHTDDALDALAASVKQPDARARNAVVGDIGGFFHPRAMEALLRCIETERNPAIVSTAIKGLAPYHQPAVRDVLLRFLKGDSYRNRLAEAAIAAMRAQDDPAFIAPLRETLAKREAAFTSYGFGEALDALAFLARNEKPRDSVREFLAGYINHKRERLQLAAMKALGTLEDPKAIALLETFASASKETPQQKEAEKAIAALRAVNKPSDNLKDLRQEVLDVKKENQRLSKELAEVKKKLDAGTAKEPEKKTAK